MGEDDFRIKDRLHGHAWRFGNGKWEWEMDRGSLVYPGYIYIYLHLAVLKKNGLSSHQSYARKALTIKQNTITVLNAASSRFFTSNLLT
jgi:hypothetical protein